MTGGRDWDLEVGHEQKEPIHLGRTESRAIGSWVQAPTREEGDPLWIHSRLGELGGARGMCAKGIEGTRAWPPNGLELSRSAEAGGSTPTLALDGDQDKPHADPAEQPGRHIDSPHRRAAADNLSARPPSRLQRVVRRADGEARLA